MNWKNAALVSSLLLVPISLQQGSKLQEIIEPVKQEINIEKETSQSIDSTLSLACWNMQIFGKKKASNEELMKQYVDMINKYDIMIVQEIRDASGNAFEKLSSSLPEYDSFISSRAGRSRSKEQYGIFFRRGIELSNIKDYNVDSLNRWERPPLQTTFSANNYNFTVYTIHTKPDEVQEELCALEQIVKDSSNVIIIGDLNADCNYYNNEKETEFDSWNWLIVNKDDTTVGETDCAYDRIIINDNLRNEYISHGIYSNNINKKVSDHYMVWIEIKLKE